MDTRTAMKFITEYSDRCERVQRVEALLVAEQERIRVAQAHMKTLQAQLEREVEDRDVCHSFARSAINALTPARGFVV
jgi:hypothetical protein